MKKILLLLPMLLLALSFVACNDDEDDMRIELASPKPQVKTELAKADFSWAEVDKVGGYAYALDASEEYTLLEASATGVTLSGLSKGLHTFKIYSVGIDGKSFDSKLRELEFEINSTVSAPSISYIGGETYGDIIVSWTKQEGAIGYAYKVKDATAWTEVGTDVLTVTLTGMSYSEKFPFSIKALGNPPLSEDSKEITEIIDMTRAAGVWVLYDRQGVDAIELAETGTGTGIYSGTISCLATDAFYINIENKKYGFMSYSGNGGIGTVNSVYAAVPYYNNDRGNYHVRESIGLMDVGTNSFYTNVDANCKVFVRVNTNGVKPSYYLKLVKNADDIVLAQYFDLMAYGGDWASYIKGTSYINGSSINVDDTGLSEGVKNGASSGTVFGAQLAETGSAPVFAKNKGLENWSFERIFEFPGYIRLSNSGADLHGVLTTPTLNYTGNIEVTFDGLKFASMKEADDKIYIEVEVLNGGKVTSAKVLKEGDEPAITIVPASENTFRINGLYNANYANNENKKWSNFTFTVENVTPQTQIRWNCKTNVTVRSENYRYCLDNIVVKKK